MEIQYTKADFILLYCKDKGIHPKDYGCTDDQLAEFIEKKREYYRLLVYFNFLAKEK
jgi:hypothetical protein